MDIKVSTTGFDILDEIKREIMAAQEAVGKECVAQAKAEGNYQDRTGNLRRSNYYENTEDGLVIGNSAEYASKVEAKGYEVISTFALRAEAKLKEIFGE